MELTIGRVNKKQIKVDEDVYLKLKNDGWCFSMTGHGYVSCRKYLGKVDGKYTYERESLHRLVTNAPRHLMVDHINCDRLDNRRENLRLCKAGSNAKNSKQAKGKYKGVHQIKSSGRWTAQITKDYKCHHLGCFSTPEEAALAYNKAAKKLHGKYAWLNEVADN